MKQNFLRLSVDLVISVDPLHLLCIISPSTMRGIIFGSLIFKIVSPLHKTYNHKHLKSNCKVSVACLNIIKTIASLIKEFTHTR